jgi:hypothetical protein
MTASRLVARCAGLRRALPSSRQLGIASYTDRDNESVRASGADRARGGGVGRGGTTARGAGVIRLHARGRATPGGLAGPTRDTDGDSDHRLLGQPAIGWSASRRDRYLRAEGHTRTKYHPRHRHTRWHQSARRTDRLDSRAWARAALLRAPESLRGVSSGRTGRGGRRHWLRRRHRQRTRRSRPLALRHLRARRRAESISWSGRRPSRLPAPSGSIRRVSRIGIVREAAA